jgi:hypothetical protein
MANTPEDNSKQDEGRDTSGPGPKSPPKESDKGDEELPGSEETRGNRVEEKVESRAQKKQETHEEAKSITGSQAHHSPRNEHPDSGPAPLKRY